MLGGGGGGGAIGPEKTFADHDQEALKKNSSLHASKFTTTSLLSFNNMSQHEFCV